MRILLVLKVLWALTEKSLPARVPPAGFFPGGVEAKTFLVLLPWRSWCQCLHSLCSGECRLLSKLIYFLRCSHL